MSHRRGGSREEQGEGLPVLSLVGRPNVGKSSLFNRLVGGRPALVEDMPGVTRDRRFGVCSWGTSRMRVVDTGGLDPDAVGILAAMRSQTLRVLFPPGSPAAVSDIPGLRPVALCPILSNGLPFSVEYIVIQHLGACQAFFHDDVIAFQTFVYFLRFNPIS